MAKFSPDRFNQKLYFESFGNSDYEALGSRFLEILRNLIDSDTTKSSVNDYQIPYRENFRIDLISKSVYSNSKLWWIIKHYNNILYINDLASGNILKIPTQGIIETAIRQYRRESN